MRKIEKVQFIKYLLSNYLQSTMLGTLHRSNALSLTYNLVKNMNTYLKNICHLTCIMMRVIISGQIKY